MRKYHVLIAVLGLAASLCGCLAENQTSAEPVATASSCMSCHNGSLHNDYAGGGLENPHPFPGAGTIECTVCHGGNGNGEGMADSHVPPPPEIGDELNQINDAEAYFNRLTLTGIDKFEDYEVNGVTYTPIDYLQFINPGDLRVVTVGRSCGECHQSHADCVAKSVLATEAGVLSGALFAIGVNNKVAASQTLYENTASDMGFRAVVDPNYTPGALVGPVPELREFPVYAGRQTGEIFNNFAFDSDDLPTDQLADGRVVSDSNLAKLYHEQIAFTCGDCHLGSAGANNRYGDYRSSGCTSCHMRYSLSGRSSSTDPQIRKNEPFDPNDIDAPERPHVDRHLIRSVARTLTTGEVVEGMDDYTCAGCHQGSNRTVMQYWGIRLDQNQDVRRGNQYPANPVSFQNTRLDTRLFDPVVGNNEFNGRNANQYLLFEDYDGDTRDDTPPDVHYEAGMGCIDCHGSHDLHGGTVGDDNDSYVLSRQEQAVAIRCESCHGAADAYALTQSDTTYKGVVADVAMDAEGNSLRHVVKEGEHYFLYSRLTGKRHYVKQTLDVIVDNDKINPLDGNRVYTPKGSYAMGRADGLDSTGIGPQQTGLAITPNFSHADNLSCIACHSSWTNNCTGCHLGGEYNTGNNFSNITGERIVFKQANADFVYQSPVPFQLGVDTHGKIAPISPNTEVFFQYEDINNDLSKIFAFSDRNARGADPAVGNPSLSHNTMMPHSIRGRVDDDNEGARNCVSCHLTTDGLTAFGGDYTAFRTAMSTDDFGALDWDLIKQHIGQNTGNELNSPLWVHMVSGLGSGAFLFDENGCPVNDLDENEDRIGCGGVAPKTSFDPLRVRYNLDRIVDATGQAMGSNNHAFLTPGASPLRDGATDPNMSGPLGATLIDKLTNPTTGIILDSWIDSNGGLQGDAATFVN